MYGMLLPRLGWCPWLLLGIVRQARKTNMQDCWLFTCCFSWTLGSSSGWGQLYPLSVFDHSKGLALRGLSLFYWYYFGRCSSELAQLVPLPFSWGRSTQCSDSLHDFSVTIPRCCGDGYVGGFFPRAATVARGVLVLAQLLIWRGDWVLGYSPMEFAQFPVIS